ncbi:MAG: NUDIX hydrolase [Candidatus Bathyarchaeota archaeon]|nr:NUDIX hydrolase [Candidatus Bathyarchaeota archaeon]
MLQHELSVEVEPRCISVWKEPWAKRFARVTLLVDFDDHFAIVVDASNGFWFLPGGGVEEDESIEETAKREAAEELGLEIKVDRIVETFRVTLISRKTGEQLEIHPFIVVHATGTGGRLKTGYAPNRKIVLVRKDECDGLLRELEVPEEYECMKPYLYVSKETVREFFRH